MESNKYQHIEGYNSGSNNNKNGFSYRMIIDSLATDELEKKWISNENYHETIKNDDEKDNKYLARVNQQASSIRRLAYIKAKYIHNYGEYDWPSKISNEEKEEYINLTSIAYNIPKEVVREQIDDRINKINSVIR